MEHIHFFRHLSLTAIAELASSIAHNWQNGNRQLVRCIIYQINSRQTVIVLKQLEDYYSLSASILGTERLVCDMNDIEESVLNSPDWENARCIIEEASGL